MNTGRKRRSTPLDENSNPNTVDMQPGNPKVPRLRRSCVFYVMICNRLVSLAHDAQERFGLLKFYYCNACDRHLPGPKALCQNEGCQLRGVPSKRSKTSKRASIFTVLIKPQLHIILERVLPLLIELHDSIHNKDQSDNNPVLSETSSFSKYDRDIESVLDFRDRKITIVLTLNVDDVRFKKLSRSESWPVYIRLEGLPLKEKNKYENIILAGIMFTRKPPTETFLVELLKHELEVLQREGIPIHTASDTWICTPKLVNGVIDFAALQTLYGLPRWQSLQGCHLCMFPGERVGWTQMMDFFTVNHCMPDALHLLSEGITTNVFKAMFGPRRGTAVMAIRRDCIGALLVALQRTRNYTYSSKFILDAEDLSKCTGSEKEAADFPGVRDLGTSMKNLWYALDPTLNTLNVHCLVDHAVLEDLPLVGSSYHWSSSSFESIHRRLLLRVPQCTTNVEETIIGNFLLHKDMVDKLEKEVKVFENHHLDRLHKKIAGQGRRPRCNVMVDIGLEGDWYVRADSVLAFEGMGEEHRQFLLDQREKNRVWMTAPASQDSPPYVPNYDTGSCDDAENALAMARAITCGTTTTEAGSNQTAVVEVQGVQEKVHLELGLDQLRALVDHLSGRGSSSTTDDDNCWEERLSASQLSTSEPSASQPAESQQARPQRQRRGAPRQTGRVQQSENDQFRVVMQRLARDNEISLRELGAALAHFDTGAQYHAFITGKMRECSISLNSAKAIQDTCSQIPHSSDSVVRSLTEVVAAQSDALVGVVTTLNPLLEFARANHRSIAKAEAMAVKNSSQSLPDEFFLHGRHLTQNWSPIHHLSQPIQLKMLEEKSEFENSKQWDWKRFHAVVDDIILKKELIEEAQITGFNTRTLHAGKEDQRSPTKGELRHKTSFLVKPKTAKTPYQLRTVAPHWISRGKETLRLTTFGSSEVNEKNCDIVFVKLKDDQGKLLNFTLFKADVITNYISAPQFCKEDLKFIGQQGFQLPNEALVTNPTILLGCGL
ncbi:unnamed protein product [Heligmosomoides polygyrus]|uniref:DUF1758 domain-containing protein n=1 Tax=Heligmosomoides polygyrus TaxID=6339 RepID=A0A183GF96_HELPZ|nr:unnamed protein product [Heligmosomoides polygyrus]